MAIDSDLLRQAVEARDRAVRHGLTDTARALTGIAALIAAAEAEAAAIGDAGEAEDESDALSVAAPRAASG